MPATARYDAASQCVVFVGDRKGVITAHRLTPIGARSLNDTLAQIAAILVIVHPLFLITKRGTGKAPKLYCASLIDYPVLFVVT